MKELKMNRYLKSALQPGWLVVGLTFVFVGCASLKRADQADGPLDAVMLLAGTAKTNVAAIEKISHVSGEIGAVRAVADNGAVSVRGWVHKIGFGPVNTANSHIDVIVLDSRGRVAWGIATTYFPSEIPNTIRGVPGRSHFSVHLPRPLPPGATLRIVFENGPVSQSQFSHQI